MRNSWSANQMTKLLQLHRFWASHVHFEDVWDILSSLLGLFHCFTLLFWSLLVFGNCATAAFHVFRHITNACSCVSVWPSISGVFSLVQPLSSADVIGGWEAALHHLHLFRIIALCLRGSPPDYVSQGFSELCSQKLRWDHLSAEKESCGKSCNFGNACILWRISRSLIFVIREIFCHVSISWNWLFPWVLLNEAIFEDGGWFLTCSDSY